MRRPDTGRDYQSLWRRPLLSSLLSLARVAANTCVAVYFFLSDFPFCVICSMYIISTIHIFCTSVLASSMHDENVYSYCWGTLCFVFLQRGVLDSFVAASAFSLILAYWGLLLYFLCFKAVSLLFRRKSFHTQTWTREHSTLWKNSRWRWEARECQKSTNITHTPHLFLYTPFHYSVHLPKRLNLREPWLSSSSFWNQIWWESFTFKAYNVY